MSAKNSVVLYESFFSATDEFEPAAIAEIWCAIRDYLRGDEPQFTDAGAKLAWKFIRPQLDADNAKWAKTRERRSNAGKAGMNKRWSNSKTITNDNSVIDGITNITNDNSVITQKTPITNITVDDNVDVDVDVDVKKENIKKKDFVTDGEKVWTLAEFTEAAKDPSVALPDKDVAECFDFYAAQGFRRSNGQPIVSVAPLLRLWKRKLGEFAGRAGSAKPDANIDAYSLERAFEWLEGRMLGDYDTDPRGEAQLREWATKNGIFERLRNPNDKLYRHVFKTGK